MSRLIITRVRSTAPISTGGRVRSVASSFLKLKRRHPVLPPSPSVRKLEECRDSWGRVMSIAFTGLLICTVLAGCAGPLLNEYTDYLGPGVGTVEEKQILENLARFVDNPWAIPGHVELASGTIQVTNQVGLVGRWTNSHGFTGANATQSVGSEFDITPAQTQDQESYNTLPVTDSDDLRRLRALYNLAVCGNRRVFAKEWDIADQKIFQPALPPTPTKTSTPPITVHPSTVKEAVSHILDEYYKDTDSEPCKRCAYLLGSCNKRPRL